MSHWKTILAYDGTPFNGWQVQPSLPTVQGTLASAIHHITGETVLPQGSGRTDTGVHALAQVATFSLTAPIPAANLHRALNRALPPSIRILSVEPVPQDFHARHSARRKTYEYRILPCESHPEDRICPPMLAPYVWAYRFPLELAPLQQAAAHVLGTHDFTSFAAVDPDLTTRTRSQQETAPAESTSTHTPAIITNDIITNNVVTNDLSASAKKSTVISTVVGELADEVEKPASLTPIPTDNTRTIFHSAWHQHEDILIYRVTGSGFLHHMVRNLVGTFVETATRLDPDVIPKILAARNRSAAGPTAPARGLFLVEVEY